MYRHIPQRRNFGLPDIVVLSLVGALIYGFVGVAQRWVGHSQWNVAIDLRPSALPKYAFFSFMRALASYLLSLSFALCYGYAAAKIKRADRIMIPVLDILQAIPVLGFMPGLLLALTSLFPASNIGVELCCIIMIFTGQAWNMCFSFYSSLKTIPTDLEDVSRVVRLTWWQRFKNVELPFSAIGLAWNSLMSMAGGWFFLTLCESFRLGNRQFQVPGIGAYMQTAIEQGDRPAMIYGLLTMFALIGFVDFVIWRPVMAWVRKFQMDETPEEILDLPFVTTLLRESWLIRQFRIRSKRRVIRRRIKTKPVPAASGPAVAPAGFVGHVLPRLKLAEIRDSWRRHSKSGGVFLRKLLLPVMIVVTLWGATRLWEVIRTLNREDWRLIWASTGLTFVRVTLAVVVGSLWTIPVGILIGLSPRLTRVFQPFVQIAASFPMPMLFPIVTLALYKIGFSLHWGSAVLMMLGVQWYILFNVLAGAMVVTRDLKDSMTMIGVRSKTRWLKLYLPSAFPALVTGWITAAGGAWNASIVAEYLRFGGETYSAPGIGSLIQRATDTANFSLLAGCLVAMVVTVVGLNQTWWRWLSDLSETKFRYER